MREGARAGSDQGSAARDGRQQRRRIGVAGIERQNEIERDACASQDSSTHVPPICCVPRMHADAEGACGWNDVGMDGRHGRPYDLVIDWTGCRSQPSRSAIRFTGGIAEFTGRP